MKAVVSRLNPRYTGWQKMSCCQLPDRRRFSETMTRYTWATRGGAATRAPTSGSELRGLLLFEFSGESVKIIFWICRTLFRLHEGRGMEPDLSSGYG